MQHSESENVRDKNFTESSTNLAAAVNDGFAKDKQTVEMEFAQRQYSPRGVVLLYFRGEPAAEVDRHFSRTFAELCCLPGSSSPENSLEDSHFQGNIEVSEGLNLFLELFSLKNFFIKRQSMTWFVYTTA